MATQDVTMDDLLADICNALDVETGHSRPEGEGWYTLNEIAAAKGWKADRARKTIYKLVEKGTLERSQIGGGRLAYYRMVK